MLLQRNSHLPSHLPEFQSPEWPSRHSAFFISVRTSSLETKLKENFALFLYSDVIARILGWFLHLVVAFRIGSSMFSAKESQFS